jgi:hypothetical protein
MLMKTASSQSQAREQSGFSLTQLQTMQVWPILSAATKGALAGVAGAMLGLGMAPASSLAQSLLRPACRLLVPASQSYLQPRRIQPNQVAVKNAMGCLSPADAVYAADGCPLRLCGPDSGVIPFPEP